MFSSNLALQGYTELRKKSKVEQLLSSKSSNEWLMYSDYSWVRGEGGWEYSKFHIDIKLSIPQAERLQNNQLSWTCKTFRRLSFAFWIVWTYQSDVSIFGKSTLFIVTRSRIESLMCTYTTFLEQWKLIAAVQLFYRKSRVWSRIWIPLRIL